MCISIPWHGHVTRTERLYHLPKAINSNQDLNPGGLTPESLALNHFHPAAHGHLGICPPYPFQNLLKPGVSSDAPTLDTSLLRTLLLRAWQAAWASRSSGPLAPSSHGRMQRVPDRCCAYSRLASYLRNPELRNSQSSQMSNKRASGEISFIIPNGERNFLIRLTALWALPTHSFTA